VRRRGPFWFPFPLAPPPPPTPNPARAAWISWRRPGDPGDWNESLPAAMSGSAASLGLRSGSYGSLAAAVAGSGGAGRKPVGGARGWAACRGEKERLLHRALRLVGRRRAGVLLLLAVASAAVFCSRLLALPCCRTSEMARDSDVFL
jgi:hypothetical protein